MQSKEILIAKVSWILPATHEATLYWKVTSKGKQKFCKILLIQKIRTKFFLVRVEKIEYIIKKQKI